MGGNGGRKGYFDVGVYLGGGGNGGPGKLRFPSRPARGARKRGSWRWLGKRLRFGWSGFGIHGSREANLADEAGLFERGAGAGSKRKKKKRGRGSQRKKGRSRGAAAGSGGGGLEQQLVDAGRGAEEHGRGCGSVRLPSAAASGSARGTVADGARWGRRGA